MFQINWKTKSFLYNIFSFLKLKKAFYLSQKYITRRSKVNIKEINKIWKYHADSINACSISNLLEVGAGKSLEQNIYFSYLYENKIEQTVIDINKMIDFELINKASIQISKIMQKIYKGEVKSIEDLKIKYNINYRAPIKTADLKSEPFKYDFCVSSTALEHFTSNDLNEHFNNLKSLIKSNGYISSVIDYSDHYSHTDKNISPLNFLQYSDLEWKKYNNLFLYQNRLRHRHYLELFKKFDFFISKEIKGNSINPPVNLNSKYNNSEKDNFILWGYFLIRN